MKDLFIKEFSIQGLFGYKDLYLKFKNQVLILIGENGFGKTTLLNALYFVLNNQYQKLSTIKFDKITIGFDNDKYSFTCSQVKEYCKYIERKRHVDDDGLFAFIKNNLTDEEIEYLTNIVQDRTDVFSYIKKHHALKQLPPQLVYQRIFDLVEEKKLVSTFDKINKKVTEKNIHILYLPTYRRIEGELKDLVPNLRRPGTGHLYDDAERLLANDLVVKFGMQDVELRIERIIDTIREGSLSGFSSVYGNMISQLLNMESIKKEVPEFNVDEIKIILDRVGINLKENDKLNILEQIQSKSENLKDNTLLVYFLEQLLNVYKKQEKYDIAIKTFRDTCNQYLSDKAFVYDESAVTLKLYRKKNNDIIVNEENELRIKQLSSGEKQIISLFSRIYLEPEYNYIVLFDEPELSLSIYWQEKLLPDILKSNRCSFLLAVTHSPFIFNNELKDFTIGIQEFIHE